MVSPDYLGVWLVVLLNKIASVAKKTMYMNITLTTMTDAKNTSI
jgi:hypothetical protein